MKRAFRFTLLLAVLAPGWGGGCSSGEPPGEPIDLEALRIFKPFQLKALTGENRTLGDYLDRVTLVALFFPT